MQWKQGAYLTAGGGISGEGGLGGGGGLQGGRGQVSSGASLAAVGQLDMPLSGQQSAPAAVQQLEQPQEAACLKQHHTDCGQQVTVGASHCAARST